MNNSGNSIVTSSLVGMLAGCFILVIVFAIILAQIGAPQLVIALWTLSFAVGIYLFSGMFGKSMRFATFQTSGKNIRPAFAGMAIATAVLSGNLVLLEPGSFYANGTGFLTTFTAVLVGLALSTVLFSASFSRSSQFSIAGILFPENSSRVLLFISSLTVIACSLFLLLAQLKLLDLFFESFFGISGQSAVALVLGTAAVCLVFGGMQSLSVARVLGFSAMTIAFFVPLVWISYRTTGNPLPQFSFGYGALEPILEIDREMIEAGFASSDDVFNPAVQSTASGSIGQLLSGISLALGIAALPHVLQHHFTLGKGAAARHAGMWSFWLVLAFMTAIPAVALFAKLNVYTSILGLQISELAIETPWLFNLSGNGAAPLIQICGQLVASTSDVIQACDRPSAAFIGIQDISINPDFILIGLGFIAELPSLMTTLIILAALLCILTTVDGLLFVAASSITTDIYNRIFRPKSPAGIKLFMNRFFLMAIAVLIVLFYPGITADARSLFTVSMVVGCSVLFPMLIARLWMSSLSDLDLGLGMVAGLSASAVFFAGFYLGFDLTPNTGDEISMDDWIPGNSLDPLAFGVMGLGFFFVAAYLSKGLRNYLSFIRRKEQKRASA